MNNENQNHFDFCDKETQDSDLFDLNLVSVSADEKINNVQMITTPPCTVVVTITTLLNC